MNEEEREAIKNTIHEWWICCVDPKIVIDKPIGGKELTTLKEMLGL